MKYYIYISDTKVDMLYPQIPQPLLKRIASNLSIDLKLFGAEVNIGAKSGSSEETRISKVRIVSEYKTLLIRHGQHFRNFRRSTRTL